MLPFLSHDTPCISVLDPAGPPPQKPLSKTSESHSGDYKIIYICQTLLSNTFKMDDFLKHF